MSRWSCEVAVDVSFTAADEEAALLRAEEIAEQVGRQLLNKRPPGRRGGTARVYMVTLGGDGDVLPMEDLV